MLTILSAILQLLDKLYGLGDTIYYFSYPVKVYYIASPEGEPADYAEKVQYIL